MRKIFCLLFILIVSSANGQLKTPNHSVNFDKYAVVDSCKLIFTYKLLYVRNPENVEGSTTEDIQILQIGNRISKYYSWYLLDYAESLKKFKAARSVPNNHHEGTTSYEIYKNYPSPNQLIYTEIGNYFGGTLYHYEEPLPSFNWKLHDEFTDVLNHRCQKATTSFRGRDYTAWFAKDIPLSNGPWKFGGLPGLIMKVEDSEEHFIFECIGIEQPRQAEPIKYYNGKYEKITRSELSKLFIRMHHDYAAFRLSMGVQGYTHNKDGKLEKIMTQPPIPYNPIERE